MFTMLDKRFNTKLHTTQQVEFFLSRAQKGVSFTLAEAQLDRNGRARILKPLMDYDGVDQGFGPCIKLVDGVYYLNPYYVYEGALKSTLRHRFCFDACLPYPTTTREKHKVESLMEVLRKFEGAPTRTLAEKVVEKLPESDRHIIYLVYSVRDLQLAHMFQPPTQTKNLDESPEWVGDDDALNGYEETWPLPY